MIRELASAAWMSCSGGSGRFGLRTSKVGFANINAKAEGIEGRPALREAFQPPGSLVPVDVFYERKKAGTGSNQ
jgi:putative SOS response-associated peptidase YedK